MKIGVKSGNLTAWLEKSPFQVQCWWNLQPAMSIYQRAVLKKSHGSGRKIRTLELFHDTLVDAMVVTYDQSLLYACGVKQTGNKGHMLL